MKSVSTARLLLQLGGERTLNIKDQWGKIPLHWAVQKRDDPLIPWMMTQGAHIDAKDKSGHTPLYNAIYTYNIKIIQLLLRQGA